MAEEHPMDGRPERAFCRDCLTDLSSDQARLSAPRPRCPNCGSPRLARHPELFDLSLAHIDCDAFYAAVEKRDNPELRDQPVIVGGGRRGVVSTCCYIARINGVRSAMPMFKALAACPDAVVVKPRMEKYVEVGKEIRELMRSLTPAVEPISIDEAFLDLSGTELLHGDPPAKVLATFARRIEEEIGITVSVGLSYNKFLAKVASDFEKPRGFAIIGRAEAVEFLKEQPVSLIWGVGKAMQKRLQKDGIFKIGTLQTMEENELAKRYGVLGIRLSKLSRGLDSRRLDTRAKSKSVSSETTFNTDIGSSDELVPILRRLSERVSARMKKSHLAGKTIVLKLKTKDFKTRTRNRSIPDATQLADKIFRNGRELLLPELDGTKFRLIGIGVADVTSDEFADPDDLIDEISTKNAAVERAMDRVRDKFGKDAVGLGLTFGLNRRAEPQRDQGTGGDGE
ncbi:MAG: DNA polymerase IV [Pseudomonadota bacterium]